jgi:hypothetical protein
VGGAGIQVSLSRAHAGDCGPRHVGSRGVPCASVARSAPPGALPSSVIFVGLFVEIVVLVVIVVVIVFVVVPFIVIVVIVVARCCNFLT